MAGGSLNGNRYYIQMRNGLHYLEKKSRKKLQGMANRGGGEDRNPIAKNNISYAKKMKKGWSEGGERCAVYGVESSDR